MALLFTPGFRPWHVVVAMMSLDKIPSKVIEQVTETYFSVAPMRQQAEYPRMDFSENGNPIIVYRRTAGCESDELQATVSVDILTIKGEKRKEEEKERRSLS